MPQIYCSHCGKLIRKSANFCQYCGTAQHGAESMQQKVAYAKHEDLATGSHSSFQEKNTHDEIKKRRLCQRALWSFFLSYIGKTGILLLLFFVGFIVEPIIFGLAIVLYVLMLYVTAAIVRHNYFFEINNSSFRKEHGVIHKHDVTVPFNRIQNVNITRSLSDRMLGLARIDIETAGSSAITKRNVAGGSRSKAEAHLPGVTMQQAEEIHDLLLKRFTQSSNPHQAGV